MMYERIYLGKDSVFRVVKETKSKKKEAPALAVAQLLDYLNGKTKNHAGKTIKFTDRLWARRMYIIYRLASKKGGLRLVREIQKLKTKYEKGKISKTKLLKELRKIVRKHKLPVLKKSPF